MMRILFNFRYFSAVLLCLGLAQSGLAAVATVSVQDDQFVPSTSSIHAGDSVVWIWDGSDHNVTSTSHPAAWTASATMTSTTARFTNTFNAAGSFPYECTVHVREGMVGTINVAAAAPPPPTVNITQPFSGALLPAPANVTIAATTNDTAGTVTNVAFFIGATLLSNVTASPFIAVANQVAAGSYTLTAIVTDNNGQKGTNTVSIQVFTPVIFTGTGAGFAANVFQFSYPADIGFNYFVQRSTDLSNWISLSTNAANANPAIFSDATATNNSGFYRVGLLPNP